MGTIVGEKHFDLIFLAIFISMLLASPLFSALVARVGRNRLVPIVFRFFTVWLIGFSLVIGQTGQPSFWTGCVFFVWVSVFNLFAVSLFWSVLADLFSSDQGKNLFGLVSAGGSLGGLFASLIVGLFAGSIDTATLLLLPVLLLEIGLFCFRRLQTAAEKMTSGNPPAIRLAPQQGTGGTAWDGIVSILRNPYLMTICVFLLLGKFCATTVYLQLINVVANEVEAIELRTKLFAFENGIVQVLTLLCQLFLARLLMSRAGLPTTLVVVPLGLALGFLGLAFAPTIWLTFGVQIVVRSGTFGLLNPAREVLFTVVTRDEKYKAKNFIDTAVFRGGDVATSQIYKFLITAVGRTNIPLVAIPCALVWASTGWFVGTLQSRLAGKKSS